MVIEQEEFLGCAIACTAGLLGVSYKRARRYFSKPQKANTVGFSCKEIVAALDNAGRIVKFFYIKPHQRRLVYRPGTIVFIGRTSKYLEGHFLLRVEGGWMNPWINYPCIRPVKAGIMRRLPVRPIYAIMPA